MTHENQEMKARDLYVDKKNALGKPSACNRGDYNS